MSSEEQLVEWLRTSFKNRKELINKHQKVYVGLCRHYPHILDIALPVVDTVSAKKEHILQMARNGEDKPKKHKSKLRQALSSYMNKSQGCYDKEFTDKIKEIRPDWFENYIDKKKIESFENMMKIMPSFVKFKEGQDWNGVDYKYIFICNKYGAFECTPNTIYRSWEKGASGHPQMGWDRLGKVTSVNMKGNISSRRKRVRNKTTNEIFESLSEASKSINKGISGLCIALKKGTKCGGYNWEYVDE